MQQVHEPVLAETLFSKDMQEMTDEDLMETLSLSDLPLYSTEWEEDFSTDSQAPMFAATSSSNHHDHFEFSPQLNPTTTPDAFPPENIIFCGKVISRTGSSELEDFKKQTSTANVGWRVFRWKWTAPKQKQELRDSGSKKTYKYNKHDFPVQKVSILTSSSSGKSKWYFLLLGMPRFSTGAEWTDIKMRQSRSSPSFGIQSGDEVSANRNGGWGLWLIRLLSCGGNNYGTTNMVTTLL